MKKKIFLVLMLSLISSNSLYAMAEGEDETVFKHRPTTVRVRDDVWVHVAAHRHLKEISADAWVTKLEDIHSTRVVVDSIRLEVHGDFSSGFIEKNNTDHHHVSAAPGFTSPVATAYFKRSDFGEFGAVRNSAKLTEEAEPTED